MNFKCFSVLFLFSVTACTGAFDLKKTDGVEREVVISDTAEEINPKVNLVFVIDNSASMEVRQQAIQQALPGMLNSLQGKNIEARVITTSAHRSDYFDPTNLTDQEMKMLVTEDLSSKTLSSQSEGTRFMDTKMKYVSNALQAHSIQSSMSAAEFQTVKSNILNNIMVGTDGSGLESGFCGLMHLLHKEGELPANAPNAFLHTANENGSKKVAFVLLSDENESLRVQDCLKGYRYEETESNDLLVEDENGDKEIYEFLALHLKFHRRPIGVTNSNSDIETDYFPHVQSNQVTNWALTPDRNGAPKSCDQLHSDFLDSVDAWLATAYPGTAMVRNSSTTSGSFCRLTSKAMQSPAFSYDANRAPLNNGNFSVGSKNFKTYVHEDMGLTFRSGSEQFPLVKKRVSTQSGWKVKSRTPIPLLDTSQYARGELWKAFYQKADQVLGPDNYVFASIHNLTKGDADDCNAANAVASSTQYSSLIDFLSADASRAGKASSSSRKTSICSANDQEELDYSAALEPVGAWLGAQAISRFTVNLEYRENITAVSLMENGVERQIPAGKVTWSGGTIDIDSSEITPGVTKVKVKVIGPAS